MKHDRMSVLLEEWRLKRRELQAAERRRLGVAILKNDEKDGGTGRHCLILNVYECLMQKMKIPVENGLERSVASTRELITEIGMGMMAKKFYPTKTSLHFTETEVKDELLKLGGIEERCMDKNAFATEI